MISKHPQGQKVHSGSIIPIEPEVPHPVIFDPIDSNAIRSAALRVTGSAGPSGMDAHAWRRLCTEFKGSLRDLCNPLAAVAQRIYSSYVDPSSVAPLLAGRLTALNKNPGVCPIGIDKIARRIISKAILFVAGLDVQEAMGCLQMCGGQYLGLRLQCTL